MAGFWKRLTKVLFHQLFWGIIYSIPISPWFIDAESNSIGMEWGTFGSWLLVSIREGFEESISVIVIVSLTGIVTPTTESDTIVSLTPSCAKIAEGKKNKKIKINRVVVVVCTGLKLQRAGQVGKQQSKYVQIKNGAL
jgi:hypothetical protein